MRLFYNMASDLYNVFILKSVSIANISIENYMEGIRDCLKKGQLINRKKVLNADLKFHIFS